MNPEKATNYGLSLDKGFNLFGGQGNFIIDYFKTDFDDKVIIDFEYPGIVQIYNSTDKKSYYQSFQAEIIYSINRFNLTTLTKTTMFKSHIMMGLNLNIHQVKSFFSILDMNLKIMMENYGSTILHLIELANNVS